MNDDLDAGLPREQSEAAAIVEQSYAQHPRLTALLLELSGKAREASWQYVFTNPDTGKQYKDVKRALRGALEDAGIQDFRFHDVRHTFGTRAVDEGAPLTGVRDALGHASLATTNRYVHGIDEGKRRAVEAQERVILEFTIRSQMKKGKLRNLP